MGIFDGYDRSEFAINIKLPASNTASLKKHGRISPARVDLIKHYKKDIPQ